MKPGHLISAVVALATRALSSVDQRVDQAIKRPLADGVRFGPVRRLMGAIDDLRELFRQFESAEESALEANRARNRMRGGLKGSDRCPSHGNP